MDKARIEPASSESHKLMVRKGLLPEDMHEERVDSGYISLLTKVHLVKAMVFPVVMYGCQSWTIKKAECRRIDAFEL